MVSIKMNFHGKMWLSLLLAIEEALWRFVTHRWPHPQQIICSHLISQCPLHAPRLSHQLCISAINVLCGLPLFSPRVAALVSTYFFPISTIPLSQPCLSVCLQTTWPDLTFFNFAISSSSSCLVSVTFAAILLSQINTNPPWLWMGDPRYLN